MKSIILIYFSREQIEEARSEFIKDKITDVIWFTDVTDHSLSFLHDQINLHIVSIHKARLSSYPGNWGNSAIPETILSRLYEAQWSYFASAKRITISFEPKSKLIKRRWLQQASDSYYLDQWKAIDIAETERKWHYDITVFKWLFDSFNVTRVIQSHPPHWNYSILTNQFASIYNLKKSKFLSHTPLRGHLLSLSSWEDLTEMTINPSGNDLGFAAQMEFARLSSASYIPPDYEIANFHETKNANRKLAKLRYLAKRTIANGLVMLKKLTQLKYLHFLNSRHNQFTALRQVYDEISLSINEIRQKKFVLIALHFQPEETSLRAGANECQYGLILRISQLIPSNWIIVIKEHPQQLGKRTNGRSIRDYDWILSIEKCVFLDSKASTLDAIRLSQAVVSISGVAIYESIANGIPVVTFGPGPHILLPGVIPASEFESGHKFEDKIAETKELIKSKNLDNIHNLFQFLEAKCLIDDESLLKNIFEDQE